MKKNLYKKIAIFAAILLTEYLYLYISTSSLQQTIPLNRNHISGKIFPNRDSFSLDNMDQHRYVKIYGWDFCPTLEGAAIDSFAIVHALNGSIASVNPNTTELISLVEENAKKAFRLLAKQKKFDYYDLRRFCCYFAIDGSNGMNNLTSTRLLHQLDGKSYFPFLSIDKNADNFDGALENPEIINKNFDKTQRVIPENDISSNLRELRNSHKRQKYKIAYLLLTHEITSYENIVLLVNKIDSLESLILIHVDLKSLELKNALQLFLLERLKKGKRNNVFIQRKSFGVIWGHISVVHAQLQGFFELQDLGDWEYVVNLSAYDWPVKSTQDLYTCLKLNDTFNWIEYWSDPENSAGRLYRPHIALSGYKGISHITETGLRWWPFGTFRAYKHHQWMILHRSLIQHLRTNEVALDVLAFMEHTWIPDESYFAIVAANAPEFKDKIISNSRRFIKFEGGWHPIWITWENRFELLVSEKPQESYFFIRKIDIPYEQKLNSWLDKKLFNLKPHSPCTIEDIGYRESCFKEIITNAAALSPDNSIILIPVNKAQLTTALNLYCSLKRMKKERYTLFLTFDKHAHSVLVEKGIMSYYNQKYIFGSPEQQTWHKGHFSKMMRQKPIMWKKLLDIGVSFWQLDADTVAIREFSHWVQDGIDIHISIDELDFLETVRKNKPIPNTSTGMMHVKNTPGSVILLNMLQNQLKLVNWMEDQEAINFILRKESISADPSIIFNNYEVDKKWVTTSDVIENKDVGDIPKKKPVIQFLDQLEFVSGHFFLGRKEQEMFLHYSKFTVVHGNGRDDKESIFKSRGLWLLRDNNMNCPYI